MTPQDLGSATGSETPTPPERRYRMIRLAAGDYLLPSNDGRTLWRIYSYVEDGSATYSTSDGREHKITGTFWASAKYERPFSGTFEMAEDHDFLEWGDQWLTWETSMRSRQEAIDGALRVSS